ncbi:MAG TPA: hypothetical protein VGB44_06650 [Flavobacterium sp.]
MKKLLLLFLSVAALSCSNDDDDNNSSNPSGTVVATIDGVEKTFNTVLVNEFYYPAEDGDPAYTELEVTATMGNSTTEVLTFYAVKGIVGSFGSYDFEYVINGEMYSGDLTSVVQTNNDSKQLKGNFSGEFSSWDSNSEEVVTIPVTNGSFDIQY